MPFGENTGRFPIGDSVGSVHHPAEVRKSSYVMQEWTKDEIIGFIEAHHLDYEEGVAPPDFELSIQPDLKMRKLRGADSIYANFVVHSAFDVGRVMQGVQVVKSFFGNLTFGWWVGPLSRPADLIDSLLEAGLQVADRYIGFALPLPEWKEPPKRSSFAVMDAENELDVREHARISAEIWRDGKEDPKETERRLRYTQLLHRRGGYVLARDTERGIGNATWRISRDGQVMYLTGAGVVPSHRKRGVYTDMVAHRLQIANARGCMWATTQAREGHSEPILRKLGFREYARYVLLSQSQ
jgi:GNAT superfamily N-acetyltransferase